MSNVIDFRTRSSVSAADDSPQHTPAPPADGLVLACKCGSTYMELLNQSVVCCARCGDWGKVNWSWAHSSK